MSDPTDDPTGREPEDEPTVDELVSARLDGEATGEEAARVASEPALRARLERFSALSARVADVPPAPSGAEDDHVAAAMAAFPGRDGSVVALPARDRSFWKRLPMGAVAAAAAVVVVAAGVIGLVATDGDDGTADTAATALDGDAGEDATMDDSATALESAEAPAGGLPEFASADDLADHLRTEFLGGGGTTRSADMGDADSAPAGGTGGSTGDAPADEQSLSPTADDAAGDGAEVDRPDPCGAVELLGLEPPSVRVVVPVVLEGRPVTAVVHGATDDWRLTVVDDETCSVVVDQAL